jgi:hypothetical protein
MAYIRRQSSPVGKVLETDVINAMRSVYNLGNYNNTGITHVEDYITGGSGEPTSCSSETISSSSNATTSIHTIANASNVKFFRNANTLYGTNQISLFDLNGNLVRTSAKASTGYTEMQLQGLHQGSYIARCQGKVMLVQIR